MLDLQWKMLVKFQNNGNVRITFFYFFLVTDRVRHIVVEVCSNLTGLRAFDEIAAYMIEPEDEVVNIFDP
jgi:hypothetical protein